MRSWRFLLGILISAAFLIYAFRGQDYQAIVDALIGVNYLLLIPALGLYFLGVVVRTYRWSILLSPVERISVRNLLPITAIGFMANNVLPLRAGELVRSYVLSKNHGVRKSAALATIAIERVFDGLTMVSFMLIAAMTIEFTSELRHVMAIGVVVFAIAIAVIVTMTFAKGLRAISIDLGLRIMPPLLRPKLRHIAESFFTGLDALRSPKALGLVTLSSFVAWGLEASMYWMIARAFGGAVKDAMGFSETLLTTGVANLMTLVPSSPGYIGPFEAGIKAVLSGALGVPEAQALSYAILVHAALWFPVTIWGAIEWWRMHLSLKQVTSDDTTDPTPSSGSASDELGQPASAVMSGAHSEVGATSPAISQSHAA